MSTSVPAQSENLCIKLSEIDLNEKPSARDMLIDECEEAVTSDSEGNTSETSSGYNQFANSTSSEMSTATLTPRIDEKSVNYVACEMRDGGCDLANIQIPIVGYEVMEERARFTVYKLRIENRASGDCWYVFRRYTDFVRLCNRLKHKYPHIVQHLPQKRILRNNFDPVFLETRLNGLQTLVCALLAEPELINSQLLQDFFCLNEPPIYSETNEESRAIFEALEDTVYQLKQQLREKDNVIDNLQYKLHTQTLESENLRKIITNSTMNCQKCQKDFQNISKMLT